MKRRTRLLAAVLCLALGSGCATVTVNSHDSTRRTSEPTWSKRYWFLFGGFVSDKHVDVKAVCGSRTAAQMQTQHTFVDGVINLVTFGILAPRTAHVWCE